MCGIIGVVSKSGSVTEAVLDGLKKLEYRGYDSVGVALHTPSKMAIVKKAGKIDDFVRSTGVARLRSTCGIGHTRWATHGRPSDENAHPHTDCKGMVAVVHNGVIRNYASLRRELASRGHLLKSETDTELIAHLIEEELSRESSFLDGFARALSRLEGSYALAVLYRGEPNRIYFARMKSTLLLGLGNGTSAVASDLPALLGIASKILVLEDGELGYIAPGEMAVYRLHPRGRIAPLNPAEIEARLKRVSITPEAASKAGYPHFMIKEIHEQPQAVLDTFNGNVEDPRLAEAGELIARAGSVVVVGAGTSLHAGLLFTYYTHVLRGRPVISLVASEYKQLLGVVDHDTTVVAVSQSGETFDTLEAIRHYKSLGARVVGVTNVVGSALDRESDVTLYIRAGPEIGVAATKTYLAQTMLLQLLAIHVARESGGISGGEAKGLRSSLSKASQVVADAIEAGEPLAAGLAESRGDRLRNMYILGRGLGSLLAMEASLKVKEIAYIHAEAYPAGESKHGPIALVEAGFPVFIVATSDSPEAAGNAIEMRARGAWVSVVKPADLEIDLGEGFEVLNMPPTGGDLILEPYALIPYFQLASYYIAVRRGYDPDKPRNLAKTVTVE